MKKHLIPAVVFVVAIAALFWIAYRFHYDCTRWQSWKDNTGSACTRVGIVEKGKYPWFGALKVGYELRISAGDQVCVRVESTGSYYFDALIYWGTVSGEIVGMAQPNSFRAGEVRCVKITAAFAKGASGKYEKTTDFVLWRIHWVGYGSGGTIVTPHVWVEKGQKEG